MKGKFVAMLLVMSLLSFPTVEVEAEATNIDVEIITPPSFTFGPNSFQVLLTNTGLTNDTVGIEVTTYPSLEVNQQYEVVNLTSGQELLMLCSVILPDGITGLAIFVNTVDSRALTYSVSYPITVAQYVPPSIAWEVLPPATVDSDTTAVMQFRISNPAVGGYALALQIGYSGDSSSFDEDYPNTVLGLDRWAYSLDGGFTDAGTANTPTLTFAVSGDLSGDIIISRTLRVTTGAITGSSIEFTPGDWTHPVATTEFSGLAVKTSTVGSNVVNYNINQVDESGAVFTVEGGQIPTDIIEGDTVDIKFEVENSGVGAGYGKITVMASSTPSSYVQLFKWDGANYIDLTGMHTPSLSYTIGDTPGGFSEHYKVVYYAPESIGTEQTITVTITFENMNRLEDSQQLNPLVDAEGGGLTVIPSVGWYEEPFGLVIIGSLVALAAVGTMIVIKARKEDICPPGERLEDGKCVRK